VGWFADILGYLMAQILYNISAKLLYSYFAMKIGSKIGKPAHCYTEYKCLEKCSRKYFDLRGLS
jgi:hypothetical protein